jgi:hypothetical protein
MTSLKTAEIDEIVSEALNIAMTSCSNLKVITYDGTIGYKALEFIDDFELHAKTKGWSDLNKLYLFRSYLTNCAKDWYKLVVDRSASPPTDWENLKKLFLDFHLPKDKNRYFKEQLNKRRQGKEEPVSHYIVSKHLLCLDVDPHMSEKEIMFYILEGLIPELKRELYLRDFKNLKEMKDLAIRVETALKFNQTLEYKNIGNDESMNTLVEHLNKLLNKVGENTTQLNDLSNERNFGIDCSENTSQTRFLNNVSRSFNNNHKPRFNIEGSSDPQLNSGGNRKLGFNQNTNFSPNLRDDHYFPINYSNTSTSNKFESDSNQGNLSNSKPSELRCFNINRNIGKNNFNNRIYSKKIQKFKIEGSNEFNQPKSDFSYDLREWEDSKESVCNSLCLIINDEMQFKSNKKKDEITENFNENSNETFDRIDSNKSLIEDNLSEESSNKLDDEDISCEIIDEEIINKIVEVIDEVVVVNSDSRDDEKSSNSVVDEKVTSEILSEMNSVELFQEKETYNFDCEQEINEIFVVKNENFVLIDEFEIEKCESFHNDFLNEQILDKQIIVDTIEVEDIEKDEVGISPVKDKVKNESNEFDGEEEVNELLVDNDKIKCSKETDEKVYERFIDEINHEEDVYKGIENEKETDFSDKNAKVENFKEKCTSINESFTEMFSGERFNELDWKLRFEIIHLQKGKSYSNNCFNIERTVRETPKSIIFKNTLILFLLLSYQISYGSSKLIKPLSQNDSFPYIECVENNVKNKLFDLFENHESSEGNNIKILLLRKIIFIFFIGFYYYIHGKLKEFLIWCSE